MGRVTGYTLGICTGHNIAAPGTALREWAYGFTIRTPPTERKPSIIGCTITTGIAHTRASEASLS
jgi:hypothetical protein